MAQYQRAFDHETSDPAVLVIVDIGAADPHRVDSDKHFMRAGPGPRPLLDAEFVGRTKDGNFHSKSFPESASGRLRPPRVLIDAAQVLESAGPTFLLI